MIVNTIRILPKRIANSLPITLDGIPSRTPKKTIVEGWMYKYSEAPDRAKAK